VTALRIQSTRGASSLPLTDTTSKRQGRVASPGWEERYRPAARASLMRLRVSTDEAHAMTLYQVGALAAFVQAAGARLGHVKPHGALYNMAARDATLADAIARAVHAFDPTLRLVGLAGSELPRAGTRIGLAVAHEAFSDRRYQDDGSLTPRSEAGAVIDDIGAAVTQALAIARGEPVATRTGGTLVVHADTLCVHGDRADAGEFARRLHAGLLAADIAVACLQTERVA
jgi:UPF0271 protein